MKDFQEYILTEGAANENEADVVFDVQLRCIEPTLIQLIGRQHSEKSGAGAAFREIQDSKK